MGNTTASLIGSNAIIIIIIIVIIIVIITWLSKSKFPSKVLKVAIVDNGQLQPPPDCILYYVTLVAYLTSLQDIYLQVA